jgi:uncharacterized protein YceK
MKILCVVAMASLMALPLFSSCSSLRSGTAVKAGYDVEEKIPDRATNQVSADQGWAAKYIPGWKAVGNFLPEPTEARTNWDNWAAKRNRGWGGDQQ